MPDILRREFAPISAVAWQELDSQAADVIRKVLAGRKIADFNGPHGWELGAVNLGRLKIASGKKAGDVPWGVREVQPLIETRLAFTLKQQEIDDVTRGAADADIDALLDAAAKAARFEDEAIFNGFAAGGIDGIAKSAKVSAPKLPKDTNALPKAAAEVVKKMAAAGVGGPYAMVLNPDLYFDLMHETGQGYPPRRALEDILGGEILKSPVLNGGVIVSTRGGDFELTVGKDFSIGYASHNRDEVEFFLTESFTFRVLDPNAAAVLKTA